jgi:hypothetical protein
MITPFHLQGGLSQLRLETTGPFILRVALMVFPFKIQRARPAWRGLRTTEGDRK